MKFDLDYLIVGQGLAGTWMSYFLQKMGYSVKIVDCYNPNAASYIASGIINPITGRKLIKTWKVKELLPFAEQYYPELAQFLNIPACCGHKNIVWLVSNNQQWNGFNARNANPNYQPYIKTISKEDFSPTLQQKLGYVEVQGSFHVDTKKLITTYRNYLSSKGLLINKTFEYADLDVLPSGEGVYWNGIRVKRIVFCEGYKGQHNPWFNWLPFAPAKGEVLIIKAPKLANYGKIIKGKVFILPIDTSQHLYWVGSNYSWQPLDETPTPAGKELLLERLEALINVPYEIVDHIAGVRPATQARRPFVGIHPKFPQLTLLNGLGTKGVSMSAYFAHHLVHHLISGSPILHEVDIQKYWLNKQKEV
ncbi:MAG: NAD(P)/FAD-dependent oxidoreductase [Chitinophagales bacterium]